MRILTVTIFILLGTAVFAQKKFPSIKISTAPEHVARLQAINRDIWTPFAEAYARSDADAYMALHLPEFIRAGTEEVKDLEAYRANTKFHFERNAANKRRTEIAFTFFERVAGTDRASERGIYRYTSIQPDGKKQHFYGKFHVFHRLQQGKWKIAVDYDSDEDNSIGQADFDAGLPPDVFEKKIEMPAAENMIRKAIADFSAKVVASDWLGVAKAYTEDAAIFPPGQPVIRGQASIETFWRTGGKVNYHKITPVEIKIENGMAYDWGIYEGRSPGKDGKEIAWEGKYVIVWKEIAPGDWRIYLDCWNRLPENARPSMKKVIAADDSLGRARNHACERIPLSQTIREYVAGLEKMDFSGCPADFSAGFRQHMDAWTALLPFTDKHPGLRGEMHDLFKQLETGPDGEAFKAGVKKVWDTWGLIEMTMKANGL